MYQWQWIQARIALPLRHLSAIEFHPPMYRGGNHRYRLVKQRWHGMLKLFKQKGPEVLAPLFFFRKNV